MNTSIIVFMLMVAPSISDIDVENHAVQVNQAPTIEDCQELAAAYTKEYAFCVPVTLN